MKHRKLILWGTGIIVVVGIGLAFAKATWDPNEVPTSVTAIKQTVAPNHIYQTYRFPYKLTIVDKSAKLYSAPAGTKGSKYLGTAASNHLNTKITGQTRDDLNHNQRAGYIKFNQNNHHYWVSAQQTRFRDLNALKGPNKQIETAISAGLKLVGHSKYDYGGGRNLTDIRHHRFDCSSFVRYCYGKAGITLGSLDSVTTFTLVTMGKPVSFNQMKRGDLFFFTNAKGQVNSHVAIYLGDHLFLHDHGQSDTGGVGITSLNAPSWRKESNGTVRRIVN
ncbi:C40 family peptidase [Lentilactobacillus farraginis]|uniref:Cell wall-binding protein n=3 Tax=Lentilactobacillus farraginis TaxID=390841 RepID=A0A0R1W8M6_9LACO|nr:C40 family peptidase [Lentilactobacillus farraginis]KRM12228.1 cell wall-binding protein [Lentilactobacillus farraginis DSM 18382 = JCM 14108]